VACADFGSGGWERSPWKGSLIAADQDLKRRLAATGWGRRFAPSGSITGPVPSSPVRAPASKVVM
jgi:hypothetical protein